MSEAALLSRVLPAEVAVIGGAAGKTGGFSATRLVANTQLHNYRCALAELAPGEQTVEISSELAGALKINDGDPVRIVAL